MFKKSLVLVISLSVLTLTGCSALHTAVKKRNLAVETKMSETIWLNPVSPDKQTVFLQIRNTTDKTINIKDKIAEQLINKGYQVINDPDKAHFWLQVNTLKVGKMDLRESQGFLSSGYGGAISGAALGTLAGYGSGSYGTTAALGVGGAIGGVIADAMVEDVNYTLVTDVQLSELTAGETVTTQNNAKLTQGTSGSKVVTSTAKSNRAQYQTRIISNANQVNLKFEEALPVLETSLAQSLGGVF